MDQQARSRRRLIATLTVVLPVLAGVAIAVAAHFAGHETEIAKPRPRQEHELVEAATPAASGSPAPRVRLEEAATDRQFDTASLRDSPYAVVFVSTRCGPIGDYLRRAATELGEEGTGAAIVVITADPMIDTPAAVRTWLDRHHIATDDPLHYLVGDEDEVRGFWNAWGFNGPSTECPALVTAHLVAGSNVDTGIVDLEPESSPTLFTGALTGLSR